MVSIDIALDRPRELGGRDGDGGLIGRRDGADQSASDRSRQNRLRSEQRNPWLAAALTMAGFIALIPGSARAWDAEGHRVIAQLANQRLDGKARAAIARLLARSADQGTPGCPVASLEDASAWPDCVRNLHGRFGYLSRMHYEDIPLCGAEREADYCRGGAFVVAETRRALAILKDPRSPAAEKLQALEEVTHFIGDMHQPLHAADNDDRGGNSVRVIVEGHSSNLNHVWDTEVLEYAVGRSETDAEQRLEPLIHRNAAAWARGDLDSWLAETHRIAGVYVYGKLQPPPRCGRPAPDQEITPAYLEGAAPMVREQLARAAVRLAAVLNAALG